MSHDVSVYKGYVLSASERESSVDDIYNIKSRQPHGRVLVDDIAVDKASTTADENCVDCLTE